MIKLDVTKIEFESGRVLRANARVTQRALFHVGAFIRKAAQRSIRKRKSPSPPGTPPHSPTSRLIQEIAAVHEHGGQIHGLGPDDPTVWPTKLVAGKQYPPRPYMGPALEAADPLTQFWDKAASKK